MATLSGDQRAQIEQWLADTGELWLDVYVPHIGRSSIQYFIRSPDNLEDLISGQTGSQLQICVFRRPQFPLRGTADAAMLEHALKLIPDGEWFHIISLDRYYPNKCGLLALAIVIKNFIATLPRLLVNTLPSVSTPLMAMSAGSSPHPKKF